MATAVANSKSFAVGQSLAPDQHSRLSAWLSNFQRISNVQIHYRPETASIEFRATDSDKLDSVFRMVTEMFPTLNLSPQETNEAAYIARTLPSLSSPSSSAPAAVPATADASPTPTYISATGSAANDSPSDPGETTNPALQSASEPVQSLSVRSSPVVVAAVPAVTPVVPASTAPAEITSMQGAAPSAAPTAEQFLAVAQYHRDPRPLPQPFEPPTPPPHIQLLTLDEFARNPPANLRHELAKGFQAFGRWDAHDPTAPFFTEPTAHVPWRNSYSAHIRKPAECLSMSLVHVDAEDQLGNLKLIPLRDYFQRHQQRPTLLGLGNISIRKDYGACVLVSENPQPSASLPSRSSTTIGGVKRSLDAMEAEVPAPVQYSLPSASTSALPILRPTISPRVRPAPQLRRPGPQVSAASPHVPSPQPVQPLQRSQKLPGANQRLRKDVMLESVRLAMETYLAHQLSPMQEKFAISFVDNIEALFGAEIPASPASEVVLASGSINGTSNAIPALRKAVSSSQSIAPTTTMTRPMAGFASPAVGVGSPAAVTAALVARANPLPSQPIQAQAVSLGTLASQTVVEWDEPSQLTNNQLPADHDISPPVSPYVAPFSSIPQFAPQGRPSALPTRDVRHMLSTEAPTATGPMAPVTNRQSMDYSQFGKLDESNSESLSPVTSDYRQHIRRRREHKDLNSPLTHMSPSAGMVPASFTSPTNRVQPQFRHNPTQQSAQSGAELARTQGYYHPLLSEAPGDNDDGYHLALPAAAPTTAGANATSSFPLVNTTKGEPSAGLVLEVSNLATDHGNIIQKAMKRPRQDAGLELLDAKRPRPLSPSRRTDTSNGHLSVPALFSSSVTAASLQEPSGMEIPEEAETVLLQPYTRPAQQSATKSPWNPPNHHSTTTLADSRLRATTAAQCKPIIRDSDKPGVTATSLLSNRLLDYECLMFGYFYHACSAHLTTLSSYKGVVQLSARLGKAVFRNCNHPWLLSQPLDEQLLAREVFRSSRGFADFVSRLPNKSRNLADLLRQQLPKPCNIWPFLYKEATAHHHNSQYVSNSRDWESYTRVSTTDPRIVLPFPDQSTQVPYEGKLLIFKVFSRTLRDGVAALRPCRIVYDIDGARVLKVVSKKRHLVNAPISAIHGPVDARMGMHLRKPLSLDKTVLGQFIDQLDVDLANNSATFGDVESCIYIDTVKFKRVTAHRLTGPFVCLVSHVEEVYNRNLVNHPVFNLNRDRSVADHELHNMGLPEALYLTRPLNSTENPSYAQVDVESAEWNYYFASNLLIPPGKRCSWTYSDILGDIDQMKPTLLTMYRTTRALLGQVNALAQSQGLF
ncbi:hypothetical protein H4R34_002444 [Dimargaris verticillata]|uniref:Uncharacterized protein n=1 Tax=Dimargaris verticillata TaxID=2761393 RepID=A0A9W8B2R3_9FUNG|nr:hypothetical protein H4R34_002444 [Dimargaris verticillata]